MKRLDQKGVSLFEMVLGLGLLALVGSVGFNVMRSASSSGQKLSRAMESDQLVSAFLNFRKKELQLTQRVPLSINLVPPFNLDPAGTDSILIVTTPVFIPGITGGGPAPAVNPPLASACHVIKLPIGAAIPIDPTNNLPTYTNAGSGCKREEELVWTGYSVNKRITTNLGENLVDLSYVSACRTLPSSYPAHFPSNVGPMSCGEGKTSFIADGTLDNSPVIFPLGNHMMMGAEPLAAALTVQRSGRSMTIKLTVVLPDGKGGFETRTKEIASTVPMEGDPAPRVQIIR